MAPHLTGILRKIASRISVSKTSNVLRPVQLSVISKIQRYPWTKSFLHLSELPRSERKAVYKDPKSRGKYDGIVAVKDRIKQWNIIPGDLVRIKGEGNKLREVFGVNKFKNLVYIKTSLVRVLK